MSTQPLRLGRTLGNALDPGLAPLLHELEHRDRVEYLVLGGEDVRRHRLRVLTDRGTDCAVAVPRAQHLENGTVLLLEADRAIVVRLAEPEYLMLQPRDVPAALELGYFAGNMHWPVRFSGRMLRILLQGPVEFYLERLAPMLEDGRLRRADENG